MKRAMFALGLCVAMAAPVVAGEAHFCSSKPVAMPGNNPLDDQTRFECPGVGNHTVPELAKAGWHVSQVVPTTASMHPARAPGAPSMSWTILIQK